MKALLLSDETWEALPAKVRTLLLGSTAPALPDPVELHRLARAKEEPAAFTAARARLEAAHDAREAMKEQMHGLILDAHARGVGPAWLARWSGYNPSRIYQIIDAQEKVA